MNYEIILCWVLVYKAEYWKTILVILNESIIKTIVMFISTNCFVHLDYFMVNNLFRKCHLFKLSKHVF